MKNIKLLLTLAFGAFMIFGGVMHFVRPAMYEAFIPDFLPTNFVNYGAGLAEIAVGIGTFIPRFRAAAAMGILVLMIGFLPLHVLDVFKENPAIGSHRVALIRLPIQFVLIGWAWFISRR